MNYFENIEGLLEETENIENTESKTEKMALDDDIVEIEGKVKKLSELKENEIIDLAYTRIENFKILALLENIGEDVSEGFKVAIEGFFKYLDYISDTDTKRNILEAAKTALKEIDHENEFNENVAKSH